MSKKAVAAIASITAGLGLFAMIAKIEKDPFTLTSVPQQPTTVAVNDTRAFDTSGIAFDAVQAALGPALAVHEKGQITAHTQQRLLSPPVSDRIIATPPSIEGEKPELLPCSPWRDLGPKLGEVKGEDASRHVRQLC